MALSRKAEFAVNEVELAEFARALAHPARIAILKEIARHEKCFCGQIVEALPLAQSTVSQHLKELVNAGLLKISEKGAANCYCINWKVFEKFEKTFAGFFQKQKGLQANRC